MTFPERKLIRECFQQFHKLLKDISAAEITDSAKLSQLSTVTDTEGKNLFLSFNSD